MAKAEPVVIESISSILVPVDGSEHALKATALASDLAEKYEAQKTGSGLALPHHPDAVTGSAGLGCLAMVARISCCDS